MVAGEALHASGAHQSLQLDRPVDADRRVPVTDAESESVGRGGEFGDEFLGATVHGVQIEFRGVRVPALQQWPAGQRDRLQRGDLVIRRLGDQRVVHSRG